jgi:organic radical activating enzyme
MTRYVVNEHFLAFQGEGVHSGRTSYFIRLQGCDQRCTWCDAAGTWHPAWRPDGLRALTAPEVGALIRAPYLAPVIVTGGEPTLYNLGPLVDEIHRLGRNVHLETAGHLPIRTEAPLDWITLSPKPRATPPLPENVRLANEFKVIVEDTWSLVRSLELIEGRQPGATVWLHPEWSKRHDPALLDFISQTVTAGVGLRAGYQLHKLYRVDQRDPHAEKRAIPLGGDPDNGPSI